MTRPTPLAILLVLLAAAAPVIDGFVVRRPAPRSSPSGPSSSRHGACTGLGPARGTAGAALQLQSQSIRAGSRSALRMMGGGVESVTPVLLAQLAGCAALVGTGKVLLKQEEEEGIEPAAPWAEGRERSEEVDLFRDTWVRYFGYFNEVGEAFRPIIPVALVTFSYLVAFAYILADSYSQGAKVKEPESGAWRTPSVLAAVDSLFFQVMASVIFPSFTINRSVAFVGALVAQLPSAAGLAEQPEWLQYVPTAVGLVVIPLICPSLDVLTHRLLDGSFRSASAAILGNGEKQA